MLQIFYFFKKQTDRDYFIQASYEYWGTLNNGNNLRNHVMARNLEVIFNKTVVFNKLYSTT